MQVQQTVKPICFVSGDTGNEQIAGCLDRGVYMGPQMFDSFVFVCGNPSRKGEAVVESCPRNFIPEGSIPVRRRPEG